MDTLTTAQEALRKGEINSNPHLAAEYKSQLAGEFSFYCGLLEDVLKSKPSWWNLERGKHKSDNACDKSWEMTDAGIEEMGLRLRIKRSEKMINALGTIIKLAEMEAHNI